MQPIEKTLVALIGGQDIERDPRRLAVIDAAHAAFMEFGIRRTSMNVIARRGGVSPATLYRWFGSKDVIVSQVLVRELGAMLAQIDEAVDPGAPAEVQLVEIIVLSARIMQSNAIKLFYRLVETEPELVLEQYTVRAGPILELMTAFGAHRIETLIERGALVAVDPVFVAEWLIRVAHSLLLTPSTRFPLDDEAALRRVAAETLSAFMGRPARAGG